MKLGGWLRKHREKARLSQEQLSYSLGISTRHLSRIEASDAVPNGDLFLALVDHLSLPARIQKLGWEALGSSQLDAATRERVTVTWNDPHED